MARASKVKSARELSRSVNEAAEAATENVLRLVSEASGDAKGDAEKVAAIAQLARICEEAADHMAKAQTIMFEGTEGGEAAIEHLDAALSCLNRLAEKGERHKATQSRAAKSA